MLQLSQGVWPVFAVRATEILGWSATVPFFAIYLLNERTVSLPIIGTIYLISGVLSFITQILGGRLADLYGARRITIAALVSASILAAVMAELIIISSSILLLASLFTLYSLIRGLYIPATSAAVATQAHASISSAFSIIYIGGNIGYMIGPAMGGLIISSYNYSFIFLLCSATAAVATVITARWMIADKTVDTFNHVSSAASKSGPQSYWLNWSKDKLLIIFLILVFCLSYSNGYQNTPLSLFSANFVHLNPTLIGYLYATNGLTVVLLQIPTSRLVGPKTKNLVFSLAIASAATFIACMIAAVSTNFVMLELVMFSLTIGEILSSVPAQSLLALSSNSSNRGIYQGYYFAFSESGKNLCLFLGPFSFAILASHIGLAWEIVAIFSLFIGLGFLIIAPRLGRTVE